MLRISFLCSLLISMVWTTIPALAQDQKEPQEDGAELAFELKAVDGQTVQLIAPSETQTTVVCFLGAECPLARLYGPRLAELFREFELRGVRFVGIDSNAQDSPDDIREYARQYRIPFPIVQDVGNVIADRFQATRTPEVFVLDGQLNIRYRGRIDNQYQPGIVRDRADRDDLKTALEEQLAGKTVSLPKTEPIGCLIGRVRRPVVETKLTFCKEISRILNRHCVECHRAGEIGPFALTEYNEVVGWGDMILETITDGRMPPWHANPKHGEFANERIMPEADKAAVREWLAGGAPFGDESELPEPAKYLDGWQLPRLPDLVLEMRAKPFAVPAEGTVEYQYFVVDPQLTEDRWISAAQVIPGNPAVVHHCIVFVRPPDGSRFRGVGWLTAYVPGQRSFALPAGRARKIPAGSKFVFQMHYTPNGSEQTDLTKVGINFADDADVTHEVYTLVGINQEFEIPPHTAGFPVHGRLKRLPAQAELLAVAPHMHLRGQSFELFSGKGTQRETLLDVPHYDFNWQHVYEFKQPLPMASLQALEFTVRFDNSKNNPVNPDPSQHVMWGDQTWEEMAVAFFEVAEPRNPPDETLEEKGEVSANAANAAAAREQAAREKKAREKAAREAAEREKKIAAFVDRFFTQFDADQDGKVDEMETSLAFRKFGFRKFDTNKDAHLTRDEMEAAARQKIKR